MTTSAPIKPAKTNPHSREKPVRTVSSYLEPLTTRRLAMKAPPSWEDSPHIREMMRLLSEPPEVPGLREEEAFFQELMALETAAALANAPESTLEIIRRLRRIAGRAALSLAAPASTGVRGH
jgi:hypothetical protein